MSFFPRLHEFNTQLNSVVCVGIDPHLRLLEDFLKQELVVHGERKFLQLFSSAHIRAAAGLVSSVKIQSSFFESLGTFGLSALKDSIAMAKSFGLFVILDAKRGDIASTMAAYGESSFDQLEADCLTITPYMGTDVIAALLPWIKKGKGIYIVWHTSNANDQDLQNGLLWDGRKVYEALFEHITAYAKKENIEPCIGWVLGATRIETIRTHFLPKLKGSSFLLPGVGAQGASIDDDMRTFLHDAGIHALLPVSRGLSFGIENKNLKNWDEYEGLIRIRLRNVIKMINK